MTQVATGVRLSESTHVSIYTCGLFFLININLFTTFLPREFFLQLKSKRLSQATGLVTRILPLSGWEPKNLSRRGCRLKPPKVKAE